MKCEAELSEYLCEGKQAYFGVNLNVQVCMCSSARLYLTSMILQLVLVDKTSLN